MNKIYTTFLKTLSKANTLGLILMRISIFVVFFWIGSLKFFQYEANGIVPFVANSPFMSFFYAKDAPEYKSYMMPEGTYDKKKTQWQEENNTYKFSYGLGILIMSIGTLVLLGGFFPKLGLLGEILVVIMTLGTLSFLITTPEVWVQNKGGTNFGFPYLSGAGRLVIKDLAILSGAVILLSNTAQKLLKKLKTSF